jgi:hypothetical protein
VVIEAKHPKSGPCTSKDSSGTEIVMGYLSAHDMLNAMFPNVTGIAVVCKVIV